MITILFIVLAVILYWFGIKVAAFYGRQFAKHKIVRTNMVKAKVLMDELKTQLEAKKITEQELGDTLVTGLLAIITDMEIPEFNSKLNKFTAENQPNGAE